MTCLSSVRWELKDQRWIPYDYGTDVPHCCNAALRTK